MSETNLPQRLETVLDGLIARKDVRSAVLAVASGDGAIRWSAARGTISPEGGPMTPATPWFIASITKLFIASAVLRMAEEGELALADRIVDRLPDSITRRLHVLDGEDCTKRITVEHLMGHTSGLPDFLEDYPPGPKGREADRRSLVEVLMEEGDRPWSLEDTVRWVRERLRPHFPPQDLRGGRARIRYSDTNYQLLIGIVEARRGAPFQKVLEELILAPLGMEDTFLPGHSRPGGPEGDAAVLYTGEEVVSLPRFLASLGDLNSTCDDLLRFLGALLRGRLFRNPAMLERMQNPWRRFSFPLDRAALRQPSWPIEYGLGMMRFRLPRLFTPFRSLPAVVGHTGSTGTWLFYAPELDLYLVGSVNQVTAGAVPFRMVPKVLRAVAEARE